MIKFTEEKLELAAAPGQNARAELQLEKIDKLRVSGTFFTDNLRINPVERRFTGVRAGTVFPFDVRTEGLVAGDEITGNVTAATDCGEISVPVTVKIEKAAPSFAGGVGSLRELSELYARDREEAYRIFKSPSFPELLKGCSARTEALFRGFSSRPVSPEQLEGFLIAAGWKKPVMVSLADEGREFYQVKTTRKEMLRLTRSTFGYLDISVQAEGDFIEITKKQISDEDFVGSTYDLEFILLRSRIGSGRRYGRIVLKYRGGTLVYSLSATRSARNEESVPVAGRRNMARLVKRCTDFILGRCTGNSFSSEAEVLLREMRTIGAAPEPMATLLEAGTMVIAGRMEEAGKILRKLAAVDFHTLSPEERGLLLYLRNRCGITDEGDSEIADRMHSLYLRKQDSTLLMRLCMLTDPDLMRSQKSLLRLFEGTFEAGSRSPLLYADTLHLLRENNELLVRLTPLVQQTLLFAARQDFLTRQLALRCAFLAGSLRGCPRILLRVLAYAYGKWPEDAILEAVVRLILRGHPSDPRFFSWYALAVKKGIRAIGLYEYYVETLPRDFRGILPPQIRKYFIYNNTLSADSRAMLYSNIVRNASEDPETYNAYVPAAESFAHESLARGRKGSDYTLLIQHFIQDVPDGREGRNLADMIFTEQLFTDDSDVKNVVVVHRELAAEEVFPVVRGMAFIKRYNSDAQIIFENAVHVRYRQNAVYSTQQLIDRKKYIDSCTKKYPQHKGIVLGVISRSGGYSALDAATEPFFRYAADSSAYSASFRNELRTRLLHFYMKNPELSGFGTEKIDDTYLKCDKTACVEILLALEQYSRAFRVLKTYGMEGVPADKLVRLASRLIADAGDGVTPELTSFAAAVCRSGKYDERILDCLSKYYEGSLAEMLHFRALARDFYVNTRPMDERIIRRCVLTGSFIPEQTDILKNIAEHGGDTDNIRAYIENAARVYLTGDMPVDPYIASRAEDFIDDGSGVSDEMRLMFLKFCAGNKTLTVHQEVIADSLLEYFTGRGIRLGFFRDLPAPMPEQYGLADRMFVEIKAAPEDRVVLHFKVTSDNGGSAAHGAEDDGWQSLPLPHIILGIFSKEFTLFYGETLVWTAEITHEGETAQTPEHKVTGDCRDFNGKSAFQRINRMLKERREKNSEGLRAELDDYIRARQQASALFTIDGQGDKN